MAGRLHSPSLALEALIEQAVEWGLLLRGREGGGGGDGGGCDWKRFFLYGGVREGRGLLKMGRWVSAITVRNIFPEKRQVAASEEDVRDI